MRVKHPWWSGLVAAVLGGWVGVTAVAAGEQFLPVLTIREGALKGVGIPWANGYIDYLTLLNERDGGINGVTLVWEECETRRVKKLMQRRARSISGAPRAVHDTGSGLHTPSLDCSKERGARSPCPDDSARDENVPRIASVHGGATLLQTG